MNINEKPEDFTRLLDLLKSIKRDFFKDDAADAAKIYEDSFRAASWAWLPDFHVTTPEAINRRGEILLGPLFSSLQNPWPVDEIGPKIPLAQIDLANASRVSDVNLGTGFLQLFCSMGDALGGRVETRVIERDCVENEELVSPPSFPKQFRGFASVGWAQDEGAPDRLLYGKSCLQILGYSQKQFSVWLPSNIAENYDLSSCSDELKGNITEFDAIQDLNRDRWSPGGFHLFGCFYPIQYYPGDRGAVLFTFESEYGFNVGDGQGQIFYKLDEEYGPFFDFDWACY